MSFLRRAFFVWSVRARYVLVSSDPPAVFRVSLSLSLSRAQSISRRRRTVRGPPSKTGAWRWRPAINFRRTVVAVPVTMPIVFAVRRTPRGLNSRDDGNFSCRLREKTRDDLLYSGETPRHKTTVSRRTRGVRRSDSRTTKQFIDHTNYVRKFIFAGAYVRTVRIFHCVRSII